jgi:hypothetical protein
MVPFLAVILSLQDSGVSILLPGTFHFDEVPADPGSGWYALCDTDSIWELIPVNISVESVVDPLVDDQGEATGWKVSAFAENPLLFLRSDAGVFESGEVTPVITMTDLLHPGSLFDLGGDESIFVEETGVYYSRDGMSQRISDVYENLYGEGVSVVWAGDLDGDGVNDLILNDCPHYAIYAGYRVFLSTEAEPGELLGEAAEFTAVSC